MAVFKKEKFQSRNEAGAIENLTVEINIDADGWFYANVPDYLKDALPKGMTTGSRAAGKMKVTAKTFDELRAAIKKSLDDFVKPDVSEEHVILYNIESHVSFATDEHGNIFPNATFPGAKWPVDKEARDMYGSHHAGNGSKGGYSLTIGAKAMTKTTYKFGDNVKTTYKNYYKGGSHLAHDNPANLLNSWSSFSLGDKPKEMPYTDEAALFFHSLMMGMAQINKRIQEASFEQDKLLSLIANHSGVPLLGGPVTTSKVQA